FRDLDRLAVRRAQYVAGAKRLAADEILRRSDDRDDADPQLELRDRSRCRDDGRTAGHVAFHVLHTLAGLDRDPAGVERDPLADESEHEPAARRRRRLVPKDDEPRLVRTRTAGARER